LKQFKIPFKGLSLGTHVYDWALDTTFFEEMEIPDVHGSALQLRLELDKQERMLALRFLISGNLEVACDRCLEPFMLPVDIEEHYYIKFGEERREESEIVLVIPETEYQIDITSLVFDFVSLAIPIRKVHPDDDEGRPTCDPDAISRLEEHASQPETDPRWDALKDLKLDNNN
jgi:uncharacterized metal-binding protein YceD (DUF177 family)